MEFSIGSNSQDLVHWMHKEMQTKKKKNENTIPGLSIMAKTKF